MHAVLKQTLMSIMDQINPPWQTANISVLLNAFEMFCFLFFVMDRALDLKPEVTQGCGFESRLWQEVSTTEVRPLSKANRQLLPGRRNVGCPLLHLDGLNAENTFHSSLYSE